jgi:hypothetical protein
MHDAIMQRQRSSMNVLLLSSTGASSYAIPRDKWVRCVTPVFLHSFSSFCIRIIPDYP